MNTARPRKQLHKMATQAIHCNCEKFYWCPVAPIFSPAGEKIEQENLEQVSSRAHSARTKEWLMPAAKTPPAVCCAGEALHHGRLLSTFYAQGVPS